MVLTKALVLKGVIGATTVAVPASLMIAYRKEIASHFSPSNLTKFDQGLIDYLDNGGDIQFKVIKGSTGDTNLTVSDLAFTENNPITISAKIKVTTETSNNIGTLTDGTNALKANLQKLNGDGTNDGTAWTWICEIQLTKEDGNEGTNIDSNYKDRIFKDSDKGLFGILKNPSRENDNNGTKKNTKISFIKNCAEARENNNPFTTGNNEIKTPKEKINIKFKKRDSEDKLIPSDTNQFNKWFPSSQPT